MPKYALMFLFLVLFTTAGGPNALGSGRIEVLFLAGEGWFGKEGYRYSLLDLALSKSGRPYTITVLDEGIPQVRRSRMIQKSSRPYIMNMGTSPEREKHLRAIYFPMFLGIGSGYRLMFTRRELVERLRTVRNIEDLRKFTIGQGRHWTDVAILENAGFNVQQVSEKKLLWKMTARGRFDLFPRGIFEIYEEYENFKNALPDLVIDEHVLITYPFAIYFFVNKKNEDLALTIEAGLRAAYDSGEIQDLLLRKSGRGVKAALQNLHRRVRIDLPAYNITKKSLGTLRRFNFDSEKYTD